MNEERAGRRRETTSDKSAFIKISAETWSQRCTQAARKMAKVRKARAGFFHWWWRENMLCSLLSGWGRCDTQGDRDMCPGLSLRLHSTQRTKSSQHYNLMYCPKPKMSCANYQLWMFALGCFTQHPLLNWCRMKLYIKCIITKQWTKQQDLWLL